MKKINDAGKHPSIFLHESSYGHLAIGGAMLTTVYEDDEWTEHHGARMMSGGWQTRFDKGSPFGRPSFDPPTLVSMYVEGLIYINGHEGAYDKEIEIEPSCYAHVVFRWNEETGMDGQVTREAGERVVYLRSRVSFADQVLHDAVYDLKEAVEIAQTRGMTDRKRHDRHKHLGIRIWYLVPKKEVPSRARQMLHRTTKVAREVSGNFGQNAKFFQLPSRRR